VWSPIPSRVTILLSQVRRTQEWEIKQSGSCFDTTIMRRIRMSKLTYSAISRNTPWAILWHAGESPWTVVRVVSEQALIGSQSVPAYIVTVTDKT
jgi:hypothetical protein